MSCAARIQHRKANCVAGGFSKHSQAFSAQDPPPRKPQKLEESNLHADEKRNCGQEPNEQTFKSHPNRRTGSSSRFGYLGLLFRDRSKATWRKHIWLWYGGAKRPELLLAFGAFHFLRRICSCMYFTYAAGQAVWFLFPNYNTANFGW